MTVQTSTKTVLYVVKGAPATEDETGYEALSFVEVGELTDLPEYGPNYEVVSHEPLKTGRTEKYKGFKDNGSLSLSLGWDPTDAGQAILSAGCDGDGEFDTHSFKVEYQDGTVEYFYGLIFSYTRAPSTSNSIVGSTVQIEINSDIVQVAAA